MIHIITLFLAGFIAGIVTVASLLHWFLGKDGRSVTIYREEEKKC